jgi:hypothetical protein
MKQRFQAKVVTSQDGVDIGETCGLPASGNSKRTACLFASGASAARIENDPTPAADSNAARGGHRTGQAM